MQKIRLHTIYAGPNGGYEPGVHTVHDDVAASLCESGHADLIPEMSAADVAPVQAETAEAPPPETAEAPANKTRRKGK